MLVEILTVMMDWIGLDLVKWTHGHLCYSMIGVLYICEGVYRLAM